MLPQLLAGVLIVSLNAYVILAGADFGGGVWDLFATGPRRERQRELIAKALSPVWEANHVWLILAVVLLFTCFPVVYSQMAITLHIPLTLMLVGIVLRGSAFIFRSYDPHHLVGQRRWGRIFSVASVATPFLLGVTVGAVASGRVRQGQAGNFAEGYIHPWLTAFGLSLGLFTVVLFAFIAAVYLTVEVSEEDLREDFRARALVSGMLLFVVAGLTLLTATEGAPMMRAGLLTTPRAIPVHLLTGSFAITALWALYRRRWKLARFATAAQASCIVWGWAVAQYPYLLPPNITIVTGAAPKLTLQLTLGALAIGALVLFPSLAYLFRIFKSDSSR